MKNVTVKEIKVEAQKRRVPFYVILDEIVEKQLGHLN